jgi:quercetin dioxygenase-like cupin family protein
MTASISARIAAAEIVLPAGDLAATLEFFTARLGLRVEAIYPADAPATAVLSGHGVRLRLEPGTDIAPGTLRLAIAGEMPPGPLVAPNGTRILLALADPPVVLPALMPSLVVSRAGSDADWGTGRAGMRYRDLIPGRLGGRFIASHIVIPEGGPVPDYVHYHKVRFQMIYCRAGWVRVVYEDQGPDFVMRAGDCVLQPPRIRHRVLESSPGLEVIEIGCPALHETLADPALDLPNARIDRDRRFEGQVFLRHEAAAAAWTPWRVPGFETRDIGMAAATGGLADARILRARGAGATPRWTHDGELQFIFVLAGTATLDADGVAPMALAAGDAFTVPAGLAHALTAVSADLELLAVALPPQ